MFLVSLFLFAVFAVAAGFANTPITLDVLSGILGVTNASAVPPAVGLLSLVYPSPSRRKNAAFSVFASGNPLGFAFGAIFGGIAATIFDWRAAYWLMAMIFLVFTIIGLFWTIVWSVKASFLALYYRLFDGLPHYLRIWWFVAVFTALAYVGCWIASVWVRLMATVQRPLRCLIALVRLVILRVPTSPLVSTAR